MGAAHGMPREAGAAPVEPLPLRLPPGAGLREGLRVALAERGAQAAFVIGGIGSLRRTMLRFADAAEARAIDGPVEILSLQGTAGTGGEHLHASVADAEGRVWGGHVAPGCMVRTTVEMLVVLLPGWRFERRRDDATGYAELVAEPVAGQQARCQNLP